MKSIIQYKFKNYKLSIDDMEYKYHLYDYEETIRDDNIISYSEYAGSYIEIPITMKTSINENQLTYFLENKENLSNLNLDKINKINNINDKIFSQYIDKDDDFLKNFYLNNRIINSNSKKDELLNYYKNGYKINYNISLKNNIKNYKKNDLFYNESDFFEDETKIKKYDLKKESEFIFNPDLSAGMKVFNEKIIYDNNYSHDYGCVFAGFLLEKYNDNDTLITRKFIINNINNTTSSGDIAIETTVKDSSVIYGNFYRYIIYPVFLLTFPKSLDYHITQDFLVCDSPYIRDIICVENEIPDPPEKLFFSYNKNKDLNIEWSRPYDPKNKIKGYCVFKRENLESPFTLIGTVDFSGENDRYSPVNSNTVSLDFDNLFTYDYHNLDFKDINYVENKISIYTVCAYDAHGNFSNYSEQICLLYDKVNQKMKIDLISLSGAPLHMPNMHVHRNVKYFEYNESIEDVVPIIKNKNKITVYCAPDFVKINDINDKNEYLLKENYLFNIFKLENQKSFKDLIVIKNFISESDINIVINS